MLEMNEERLLLYAEIRKHNPNASINNIILIIDGLEKLYKTEMNKYYRNYMIFNGFEGEHVYLLDYFDDVDKRFIRGRSFMNYDIELLQV